MEAGQQEGREIRLSILQSPFIVLVPHKAMGIYSTVLARLPEKQAVSTYVCAAVSQAGVS
jgi:hypothetical protein